jgi:hypothetical protein
MIIQGSSNPLPLLQPAPICKPATAQRNYAFGPCSHASLEIGNDNKKNETLGRIGGESGRLQRTEESRNVVKQRKKDRRRTLLQEDKE